MPTTQNGRDDRRCREENKRVMKQRVEGGQLEHESKLQKQKGEKKTKSGKCNSVKECVIATRVLVAGGRSIRRRKEAQQEARLLE